MNVNVLDAIMAQRWLDIEKIKAKVSAEELLASAVVQPHYSLIERLADPSSINIIAEMKKASPSAGLFVQEYEPARIAKVYSDAGAAGISVLTEPRHFMGSLDDLVEVRKTVGLPILRKDFMCDPYEVLEAAAFGANVVLLIVAALARKQLAALYKQCVECGLEVLVEAHTAEEVGVALDFEGAIIGVNSRNLKTLDTDLDVAKRLSDLIPSDRFSVAESGIKTREDIETLKELGYNGFLIGEALMKSENANEELELLGCQKRR